MNVGSLNKRITIEAPTKAPDGMSGFTDIWTAVASDVPAAIWPVSGKEIIRGESVAAIATDRIVIRYRKVMRTSWRISWAGKYFNIVSIVDPNRSHEWLHILCKVAN